MTAPTSVSHPIAAPVPVNARLPEDTATETGSPLEPAPEGSPPPDRDEGPSLDPDELPPLDPPEVFAAGSPGSVVLVVLVVLVALGSDPPPGAVVVVVVVVDWFVLSVVTVPFEDVSTVGSPLPCSGIWIVIVMSIPPGRLTVIVMVTGPVDAGWVVVVVVVPSVPVGFPSVPVGFPPVSVVPAKVMSEAAVSPSWSP